MLSDAPGACLRAVGGDVALPRCSCCVGAWHAHCGWCLAGLHHSWWWQLVVVVSKVGRHHGQRWWLRKRGVVC